MPGDSRNRLPLPRAGYQPLPVAKISAGTPGGFACLVDGRYLSLRAAGGITTVTADLGGLEPVVLTFAGGVSISPQDNPAFAQAYPLVTIHSRSDPPGTDYAVELITGLHAADIYLFDAASPQYRAVISKSYALDLSQSETLTEAAASYAPFLSEALYTPDGALAALPMGDINAPLLYEVYLEAWRVANLGPLPATAQGCWMSASPSPGGTICSQTAGAFSSPTSATLRHSKEKCCNWSCKRIWRSLPEMTAA